MSKFTEAESVNFLDIGSANEKHTDVEVDFDEFKGVTDEAALFVIDDEEFWFPRSQIVSAIDGCLTLTEWIAVEKGLA